MSGVPIETAHTRSPCGGFHRDGAHQVIISPTGANGESDRPRSELQSPQFPSSPTESRAVQNAVLELGVTVVAEPAHPFVVRTTAGQPAPSSPHRWKPIAFALDDPAIRKGAVRFLATFRADARGTKELLN